MEHMEGEGDLSIQVGNSKCTSVEKVLNRDFLVFEVMLN